MHKTVPFLKDNSAKSQRQRILRHLQAVGNLNTLEARHKLDCLHPAMRVLELKKIGHDIQTVWINALTPEGCNHRVGQYILNPTKQRSILDIPGVETTTNKQEES
jgi:hypothetical protein